MELLFWISIITIAFVYIGYGILIKMLNLTLDFKKKKYIQLTNLPDVALIIAAYNEQEIINDKIINSLSINYPKNLLKIYVVSDGSNDATNEIVRKHPFVKLIWQSERSGKTAAINRAMQFVTEKVTVFTDANVMLNANAILNLVKHYAHEKIGGVSGEKRVLSPKNGASASTEGLYWKYESFLKNEDAKLSSLVGAAGELFSIRTDLFKPLPNDTLLDDFMISLNIIRKGYFIAYEPNAFAIENPSSNLIEEYKRKVRISAGGLQSIIRSFEILNPFRYGILSFQYFFHRFSRWILTPILIPIAFISNIVLATQIPHNNLYVAFLFSQIIFHLAGVVGWSLEKRNIRIKLLFIPFYFDFMHYCIIVGWFKYISGNQKVTWEKATRLSLN